MQKTWIKLEELENTYNTLRSARLPLINFGSEKFVKRMDSQIFSKSKVQDSVRSDLPSATVLMKMMGHDFDSSRAISTWNLFIFIVISFLFPQNPGCKARFSGYFNKLALIFMNWISRVLWFLCNKKTKYQKYWELSELENDSLFSFLLFWLLGFSKMVLCYQNCSDLLWDH